MEISEKLSALNTMVGGGETEQTMSIYLRIAEEKILSRLYPFEVAERTMPQKYEMLQLEIAAYLMNKRGAEGQLSHSENGISRSYESGDVPESMMKRVIPYCGVVS